MAEPAAVWTTDEREAWRPHERLTVSQWAEKYRVLPRSQSSRFGPWRNANAPYLVGMMDIIFKPGVFQVNIVKAGQVGGSEALRNVIGYLAHQEPDPVGIALPDESKGREIIGLRVLPMFRGTPALRKLATGRKADFSKGLLTLANGFTLHLMWSGSASSLASNPMRAAFNDEVDKFVPWTGRESDPVSLTAVRLRTYEHRARQVNNSTPTTRSGKIWRLWEESDYQLYYLVPCPQCGHRQRLVFGQLKWDAGEAESHDDKARHILKTGAVWYECERCTHAIAEADKEGMVAQGAWGTLDGAIPDALALDRYPPGCQIGMHLSALYCLWEPWSKIAADFLRAVGKYEAMQNFLNSTLAEPFDRQADKNDASQYAALSGETERPEGVVPPWACKLVATVDTQHDYFYGVLRAWGPGMRSARVWHGRLETFESIEATLLNKPWPYEGDAWPPIRPELLLIDSGGTQLAGESASRTSAVYRWALKHRARVRPIKGASRMRSGLYIWTGKGFLDEGPRAQRQVRITLIDTGHYQDELAELMARRLDDDTESPGPPLWELNRRVDDEYNRHLSNMHKVPYRKAGTIIERWEPIGAGARIDYRDCEVYQVAGAYLTHAHLLPAQEDIDRHRESLQRPQRDEAPTAPTIRRSIGSRIRTRYS